MQTLSRAGPTPSPLERCAAAALGGAGKEDAHPLQKAPCTLPPEGTAEAPDRTSLLPALLILLIPQPVSKMGSAEMMAGERGSGCLSPFCR